MGKPWYSDGLKFTCTRCGDCCTGAPGYVWITEDELAKLAEHLNEPLERVRLLYSREVGKERSLREKSNGDCIFFDRQTGCQIYSVRPQQCRTWPFWESNVRSPEAWKKVCSICPGSGQGELISAEEITSRLRQQRL